MLHGIHLYRSEEVENKPKSSDQGMQDSSLESEAEADPGEESGAATGGVLASDHLQAFALSWGSGRHGTIHCARCVLHAQGDL